MAIQDTVRVLNRMVAETVIDGYALAGAVAAYNYIEPTVTDDLDVLVAFGPSPAGLLVTLEPIIAWLRSAGHREFHHEGIIIEGWTVQFLPVAGPLDAEALEQAITIELDRGGQAAPARIVRAEHLVAKALEVGRPKDFTRVAQFLDEGAVDMARLNGVLERFGLVERWNAFRRRAGIPDPPVGGSVP